ncbi:MAG: hypothetical protein H7199_09480 [Burkholderiales bacterium]|nr:hypothetical protein [Flavobacterium sp.]
MKIGKYIKILAFVCGTVIKLNLFKTLYFNFKELSFMQALKLPVHFYGKTDFVNLTGTFKILTSEIHFGMIVFGGKHEIVVSSNVPTRIYNSGTIEFFGPAVFARGINIMVWDNGLLSIGQNFSIGSLSRLIIFRNMKFGADVLVSWECQFFDTDFHFFLSDQQKIKDNCADVFVDDGVWIGCRVTVLKNTKIAKKSIVAAGSLCSGNYIDKFGEAVLLGGMPAILLKNNVSYLKNKCHETELFDYFAAHPNTEIVWNK